MIPFLRIALAVASYLAVALLAALAVRRAGRNLEDFGARTSPLVVAVGAVANLLVLGIVLALFAFVDRRPWTELGLGMTTRDASFMAAGVTATFVLGAAFVYGLARARRVEFAAPPRASFGGGGAFVATALVLLVVVAQEEALYRGYVIANLASLAAPAQLLLSTAIFVAIHFATNRGDVPQTISWIVGGLVLGAAYLASGSLWVAIALHFATNLANVVLFGIAGRFALVPFAKAPSGRHRAVFRVGYGLAIAALLFAFYRS